MKTSCKQCCFLKQDYKGVGCVAGQYCIFRDDNIYTPGFCRLKRNQKWKDSQSGTCEEDFLNIAKQENILKFDLMIIFDECIHSYEDLEKTTEILWMDDRCKQIIICDITGNRVSNGYSKEFLDNYNGEISLKLDCSVNAENAVRSIRRMVVNCREKYFLVLPAGKILSRVNLLAQKIQKNTRNILWMFPQQYGYNTIVNYRGNTIFSLYHKDTFKFLTDHCIEKCLENDQPCKCKPFFNYLKRVEEETSSEVFLSQTIDNCVIVHGK